MPRWHTAPAEDPQADEVLDQILQELVDEIQGMPSFEKVVGVSLDKLAKHATQALITFMKRDQVEVDSPDMWLQVYCAGFVVGTKYGAKRAELTKIDHMEGTTDDEQQNT